MSIGDMEEGHEELFGFALYRYEEFLYTCRLTRSQAKRANTIYDRELQAYQFIEYSADAESEATHMDNVKSDATRAAWEKRYASRNGLATYPFDIVVSHVKRASLPSNRPRALDFGFGAGNHLWMLKREGFDTWGIDTSSLAKAEAIRTAKSFGEELKDGQLLVGDSSTLSELPEEMFDLIIDRQSLVQVSFSDAMTYVSEFNRILKTGGQVISVAFSDYHHSITEGKHIGEGLYDDFIDGPFKEGGQRQFYSLSQLRDLYCRFTIETILRHELGPVLGRGASLSEYIIIAVKK